MRSFPSPQSGYYPFGCLRGPPSRDLSSSQRTGINSDSDLHLPFPPLAGSQYRAISPTQTRRSFSTNNCTSSKSRSHTRTSRTILHFTSRMDIASAVHTYIMYIIYRCTVCQYTHDHQSHLAAGGLPGNERFILSGWQRHIQSRRCCS